jgi:uncharacterized membrane protein YqjE
VQALIGRLIPVVLRHLDAYAEVVGEDAREATAFVARRLILLLIAGACAFVALLMLCAWMVILAWDTPWRAWTAAGLVLLFGGVAAALAWPALRGHAGRHALFFHRIRSELSRDRELIANAFNKDGFDRDARGGNGVERHAD